MSGKTRIYEVFFNRIRPLVFHQTLRPVCSPSHILHGATDAQVQVHGMIRLGYKEFGWVECGCGLTSRLPVNLILKWCETSAYSPDFYKSEIGWRTAAFPCPVNRIFIQKGGSPHVDNSLESSKHQVARHCRQNRYLMVFAETTTKKNQPSIGLHSRTRNTT